MGSWKVAGSVHRASGYQIAPQMGLNDGCGVVRKVRTTFASVLDHHHHGNAWGLKGGKGNEPGMVALLFWNLFCLAHHSQAEPGKEHSSSQPVSSIAHGDSQHGILDAHVQNVMSYPLTEYKTISQRLEFRHLSRLLLLLWWARPQHCADLTAPER